MRILAEFCSVKLWLCLIFLTVVLSGCRSPREARTTVVNNSGATLYDVSVRLLTGYEGDPSLHVGDIGVLPTGLSVTLAYPRPQNEGCFQVSGKNASGIAFSKNIGYVDHSYLHTGIEFRPDGDSLGFKIEFYYSAKRMKESESTHR